jgi:mono/diheme cytochrome c family protein
MNMFLRWPVRLTAAALFLGLAGCGTNLEEILFQSTTALGRTAFDVFLTEVANDLADALDRDDMPPDDGDGDADNGDNGGDGDGDGGDGGDGGTNGTDGVGAGEAIYADNGCAACHCADATGGCALDAPSLVSVDPDILAGSLNGDTPHPGGTVDLSDQELADLAAYLASLGDSGDGNGGLDGAALTADNCAACHGADGATGFAPDISGQSAAELAAGLESPTHGSISLSDDEVAAIAEFLGG